MTECKRSADGCRISIEFGKDVEIEFELRSAAVLFARHVCKAVWVSFNSAQRKIELQDLSRSAGSKPPAS